MKKPFKNTFGLDISNSALTAVELSYSKKGLRVVNFARVELNAGIVEDNCIIVDKEAFREALEKLLQEGYAGPITSKNVIFSIPEEKTFSHRIRVLKENSENEEYIKSLAKDFIPVDLSETATDFKILESDKKEVEINFIAAQKYVIESIISVISEVGLKTVFVDVDKNSMIRACVNDFQNSDSDYMILNAGDQITSFSINGRSGASYALDSEISGDFLVEKIREGLKASTSSDIRSLLLKLAVTPDSDKTPEYDSIKNIIKEPLERLTARISELANAAETQDSLKVKKVFLVGRYSRVPGLADSLKKIFPEADIIVNFSYIQLNEYTELDYSKAIGLALKAIFNEKGKNPDINLLPRNEREELFKRMLTPFISKGLFGVTSVFTILILITGITMAKSYLGYKISEREVEISAEKSDNPYLHKAAQDTQQRSQLASQVTTILKDSLPIHKFIPKIDSYNSNGIQFVSLSYSLTSNLNQVNIRAKTDSREVTEKLVSGLQNDQYFSNIVSPLSNLSGKGERFINIDLQANLENVLADMNKSKPKMPDPANSQNQAVEKDETDKKTDKGADMNNENASNPVMPASDNQTAKK